jgi:hypothetical protein
VELVPVDDHVTAGEPASGGQCRARDQDREYIAHLAPLDERMTQGKLRLDLVAVSPANSLPRHVALFDQLGEDPLGGAFGDPDRSGDVAQADSRIMSHAREDVGVVGQKVPNGSLVPENPASCFQKMFS